MEPISINHRKLRAPILRLQSDERLARMAAGGDTGAFDLLVRRHRSDVLRACGRILGQGGAEDAAQRTLIAAHQALLRNGPPDRFQPWLQRIAINSALKEVHSRTDDLPLDEERVDGVEQPDERLERRERLRSTVAAIGTLPEGQRKALVLRELEGRSHEEIAGTLGLSKGAVRQLIHRARTSLRSAATAVTPYGLLTRLDAASDGSTRAAEAVAGGGAAAFAGKTLVAAILAGGIASGISMLPEDSVPPGAAAEGAGKRAQTGASPDPEDGGEAQKAPGSGGNEHHGRENDDGEEDESHGHGGGSGSEDPTGEQDEEELGDVQEQEEAQEYEEPEEDGGGEGDHGSSGSAGNGSSGSGSGGEDEPEDDA